MGATLVETLFAEGEAYPTDQFFRLIGGLDPTDKTKAYRATADGSMIVEQSNSPAAIINNVRSGLSFPIFNRKQLYAKDTVFFTEALVGAGTSTFSTNDAAVLMALTTASGDKVTRQSKVYLPCEIGWTQLAVVSGVMAAGKTNLRQRIGIFDGNNGAFFELNGTTLRVVIRTNTSGAPVDTVVAQASWNVDVLDGTGESGITLDITKIQSFMISIDWPGNVRFGFIFQDLVVTVHQHSATNVIALPFARTPVLPVRWEIENTAATGSSSTLIQQGAAIFTAGASEFSGLITSATNGVIGRSVVSTSQLPILSVRLKSAYDKGLLQPVGFETLVQANQSVWYELKVGGTLTGDSFVALTDASEYDVSATAHTGGVVIKSGYIAGASRGGEPDVKVPFLAGISLSGVRDIITLLLRTTTGTANATFASLTFREII